jgi:transposase InsO family protein
VVIDLFSRRVVGWSMQPEMHSNLVIDALEMAWFGRSSVRQRMKYSRGCSGITRHACTQPWATSAPSSLNSNGIEQRRQSQPDQAAKAKQAMEK